MLEPRLLPIVERPSMRQETTLLSVLNPNKDRPSDTRLQDCILRSVGRPRSFLHNIPKQQQFNHRHLPPGYLLWPVLLQSQTLVIWRLAPLLWSTVILFCKTCFLVQILHKILGNLVPLSQPDFVPRTPSVPHY